MDAEGGEDEDEKEAIRVYARIRPDNDFADEVYISSRFGKQKTIQASMRRAAPRSATLLLMRHGAGAPTYGPGDAPPRTNGIVHRRTSRE